MSHAPIQLHVERQGSGTPLLILHGLFGSGQNWRTLAKRVLAPHFEVWAVDLRNHGQSPHTDTFTYEAMADDVIALIEDEAPSSVHLLGHSLGGKVAMHTALKAPHLIDKLIVVDIAPKAYDARHSDILAALTSLDLKAMKNRDDIDSALSPQIPNAMIRQFLLKNAHRLPEGGFTWKIHLDAINTNYHRVNETIDGYSPRPGPTLFVRGGKSTYVLDEDLTLIERWFPDADLVTIDDAGHWIHYEAPKPFSESIVPFLLG